ncbi:biotin transporter BioY [Bariatricus massiliensis]|uniref:Biotin transporter n=1 Tax=Bariatricus massiliensis TaxID=1745713 RepID=A0ABS8DIH3_9FIRM|nr:biotin transporter BioY [Bariatricus massiliensis]MCB7305011.1 biotin transporter BioY [Bariatricus massiliensis]MCB7375648.1 biotin transporter BioY [Bariatricus massiliensis]MCB7388237.1 biotin transporter BioY [Bariatricus massiliensis]MCB7412327.1 biotin transporter BioY [Bariatricus massiliensis]
MHKTSANFQASMNTRQMVLIALMTAVTCILAPFSIPIPISPVPISLTNLVLYISVFILSWKQATLSYAVYLLLGIAGLPVFSGFAGGLAKVAGPTGGYLAGFIFLTILSGFVIQKSSGKYRYLFYTLGLLLGTAVMYVFGTFWLAAQMNLTFAQGLAVGVLPYLPVDIIKIVIALVLGPILRKRLCNIH